MNELEQKFYKNTNLENLGERAKKIRAIRKQKEKIELIGVDFEHIYLPLILFASKTKVQECLDKNVPVMDKIKELTKIGEKEKYEHLREMAIYKNNKRNDERYTPKHSNGFKIKALIKKHPEPKHAKEDTWKLR